MAIRVENVIMKLYCLVKLGSIRFGIENADFHKLRKWKARRKNGPLSKNLKEREDMCTCN